MGRKMHFVGIERDVPFGLVVFYYDTYQFFHDFLAACIMLGVFCQWFLPVDISQFNNQSGQNQRKLFFPYQHIAQPFCLYQYFEIIAEQVCHFRRQADDRFFQNRGGILYCVGKQKRVLYQCGGESDKGEPAIGCIFCYLYELVGIDYGYRILFQFVLGQVDGDFAFSSYTKQYQAP